MGGLGGEQPGRRERGVHRVHPRLSQLQDEAGLTAIENRRAAITKSTTNWAANATISRAAPALLGSTSANANTAAGSDRKPGVRDLEQQPAGPAVPRMIPGSLREREGDRDRDRHDGGGHREQEGDERQLSWRP